MEMLENTSPRSIVSNPGLRESLQNFAEAMEQKLRKNDHKGGWEGLSFEMLLDYLKLELHELEVALKHESPKDVAKEAVDIANFALMIWQVGIWRSARGEHK